MITYNKLGWYPRVFTGQLKNFVATHVLFIMAYIYFVKNSNWKYNSETLVLIYASVAFSTTVTTGREGASTNYFIESVAILSVSLGLVFNHTFAQEKPSHLVRGLICVIIFVQLLIMYFPNSRLVTPFNRNTPEFGFSPDQNIEKQCNLINDYVA